MSSFGVDFGQKVDLTASIRNILRNYPEGTAVLKELGIVESYHCLTWSYLHCIFSMLI